MSNNLNLTTRLLFLACILLVLSCNKILDIKDLLHRHDDDKLCRVLKITSWFSGTEPDSLISQFAYNKKGDPVSITFSFVGTGRPNLIFRYDKYGRLSDYAGVYTPPVGYEFWYHYQYQDNRIVSDTLYYFGQFSGDTLYPSPMYLITDQYQYDNFGRISQRTTEYLSAPGVPPYVSQYSYNNNGNLGSNLVYDNKVNIHRTNDVWMFVDRNYSVNNPVKATSYNSKGLPLSFNQAPLSYLEFLYDLDISRSTIVYQCDGNDGYKKD